MSIERTVKVKKDYVFNEGDKPYVVSEIKSFTDSTGKEWKHITMTGPDKETYSSYAEPSDTISKIGDTVIIGHNAQGDYIVHVDHSQMK